MSTANIDQVDVHLDAVELGPIRRVGSLRRTGNDAPIAFAYDPQWLDEAEYFVLDPTHFPYPGDQFPAQGRQIAGIFADCAPDRWGRLVMERQEVESARLESRRPPALGEWDFLLRVSDPTRMGALRFALPDGSFLASRIDAVPPLTQIGDLQRAARVLESRTDSSSVTQSALALLLAPGSSLGGARPKATLVDDSGRAWIAKFPAATDRRDMAAWECVLNLLARRCGIVVPDTSLLNVTGGHRTFLARRFDRDDSGNRRLYASAMTLAVKSDRQPAGYADIAEAIEHHGAPGVIADDLAQLFRRLVFNILCGHRDDHLRNHGFLRTIGGWRLAPAFDLNPMPDMSAHELALGLESRIGDVDVALAELAPLCRLSGSAALAIVEEVRRGTGEWRSVAAGVGIPRSEIALMDAAFATH